MAVQLIPVIIGGVIRWLSKKAAAEAVKNGGKVATKAAIKASKKQVVPKPTPKVKVKVKKPTPKKRAVPKPTPKVKVKKVTPKKRVVKKATPKKRVVKKATPKKRVVKKVTPKKRVVKKVTPKKRVVKKVTPKVKEKGPTPKKQVVQDSGVNKAVRLGGPTATIVGIGTLGDSKPKAISPKPKAASPKSKAMSPKPKPKPKPRKKGTYKADTRKSGALRDSRGNVVRSGSGNVVSTGYMDSKTKAANETLKGMANSRNARKKSGTRLTAEQRKLAVARKRAARKALGKSSVKRGYASGDLVKKPTRPTCRGMGKATRGGGYNN